MGGWGHTPGTYKETDDLSTCEGANYVPGSDPWGTGNDGSKWCPLLPTNWTAAQQVAACKTVCDDGGHACAGFVVYGQQPPLKNKKCCFRADTHKKPKCAGHGGTGTCCSCFEKLGRGIGPSAGQAIADLEPLMLEHHVDVYFAGHAHFYETTWPVADGATTQKSYDNITAGLSLCVHHYSWTRLVTRDDLSWLFLASGIPLSLGLRLLLH